MNPQKKLALLFFLFSFFLTCFSESAEPLLSFNFDKIALHTLINILAQYSHKNVILNSQIPNQEISLHLEKVQWQEALDLILSTQNLAKRQIGNTLIIGQLTEINQQIQQQFLLEEQQKQQAKLTTRIIHLRYAKAQDIANTLKENNNYLLTSRGYFAVDSRTNSLWLEDTPDRLEKIGLLIENLDRQAPQVSIEARVVTVDSHYEKELGVRFGLTDQHHVSGSLTAANQLAGGTAINSIPLKNRLNFDFPAASIGGDASTIGIALAKISDSYLLDLELSALEAEGAGEVIAKPSLVTVNQQTAIIQTGEEIPYQEKTSSGATNVAFKKAVLSLEVTPQITANQHISLVLHISQDKPSSKLVNGVPAIDTREIQTQVLMNNNQTLVLGGIYEETQSHQVERIPFISQIPGVGKLFQHHHEEKEKRELLIFVKPSIVPIILTDAG